MSFAGVAGVLAGRPLASPVLTLIGRCGTKPSHAIARAVNEYVRRGQASGWFGKHLGIFLYFLDGAIGDAGKNVVGVSYDGAGGGTITHIPTVGIQAGGSSGYVDHGIVPSSVGGDFTKDRHFLWLYQFTDSPGATFEVGANGGGYNLGIRTRNGTSTSFWSGSANADTVSQQDTGFGFSALYRLNDSTQFIARRGGAEYTKARTADGLPNGKLNAFRLAMGSTYSPNGLCAWGFGALELTAQQREDHYQATVQLLLRVGAIATDDPPVEQITPPNYFTAAMSGSITPSGLQFFQQARPPSSNSESESTYRWYPTNYVSTTRIEELDASTWTNGTGSFWDWIMRSNARPELNANLIFPPIPMTSGSGVTGRAEYTTSLKGLAVNLVRARFLCGAPGHDSGNGYLDAANEFGFDDADVIGDAALRAAPTDYFTGTPTNGSSLFKTMTDKIPLPSLTFPDLPANMRHARLDYEVADGVDAATAETMLLRIIGTYNAYGAEVFFYPIALNRPSIATYSGLNVDNLWKIRAACRWFGIPVFPNSYEQNVVATLDNQVDLLRGPDGSKDPGYSGLVAIVGIGPTNGELPADDCRLIRAKVVSEGWGGIDIWRFYGLPGGGIARRYNENVAILAGLIP